MAASHPKFGAPLRSCDELRNEFYLNRSAKQQKTWKFRSEICEVMNRLAAAENGDRGRLDEAKRLIFSACGRASKVSVENSPVFLASQFRLRKVSAFLSQTDGGLGLKRARAHFQKPHCSHIQRQPEDKQLIRV